MLPQKITSGHPRNSARNESAASGKIGFRGNSIATSRLLFRSTTARRRRQSVRCRESKSRRIPLEQGVLEETAILTGGDPFSPGQVVDPGVLSAVPGAMTFEVPKRRGGAADGAGRLDHVAPRTRSRRGCWSTGFGPFTLDVASPGTPTISAPPERSRLIPNSSTGWLANLFAVVGRSSTCIESS